MFCEPGRDGRTKAAGDDPGRMAHCDQAQPLSCGGEAATGCPQLEAYQGLETVWQTVRSLQIQYQDNV